MKKYYLIIAIVTLVFSIGCSNSDDSSDPALSNNNRTMSFNGGAAIAIDTLLGQFVKDYNVSPTVFGNFVATNYTEGTTLLLSLYDEDENSFPFTTNGVFPINTEPIRAEARYTTFGGTDIVATSGSAVVSEYRRIEEANLTLIEISGTFNFTDGSESVEGRFDNVQLICLECN